MCRIGWDWQSVSARGCFSWFTVTSNVSTLSFERFFRLAHNVREDPMGKRGIIISFALASQVVKDA